MTPEQIQELINKLFETGQFVGTNAWRIALRQVYVDAWTNVIGAVLALVLGLLILWLARYVFKNIDGGVGLTLGCVDVFIATIFIIANSLSAYQYFMNPEWYAISRLASLFIK